ncbi:NitT/TauT family transport system permease protein [Halopenitus malekzadehii]|uniref:NitT/TauT family transport system permease protein n=1 Tax=Halopenitus malekzadehii TaxID=1267564 RepID=A0A1H6JY34_9EURY|nr:ABC transporter permease [Halopenitus malekzadehii]SEH65541.1 NitT/TauT family transport system permease protein [Halopenitus malekzadehii]
MATERRGHFGNWKPENVKPLLVEDVLPRFVFLVGFLAVWQVIAVYFSQNLLPTPMAVFQESISILVSGEFFYHLQNTVRRVFVAFVAAWFVSIALGVWMGLSERAEKFFDMGIIIGITIPGLATAIISVMLFGLQPLTAYLAVFVAVFPMITLNFWEGVKDIDLQLVEMGEVFDFGRVRTIRHVVLPQLIPYMLSAGRLALGLAWKLVVIVEFLGFGNGIGYMLTSEYNQFNMAGVLAWTALFTVIMLLIEYGGFKLLERRYLAWRPNIEIRGQA